MYCEVLNLGGLLGAVAGGAIAYGIVFSCANPFFGVSSPYGYAMWTTICGAMVGNLLWARFLGE